MTLATGVYNERLVRRGEFSLSLDYISQWDKLLSQMNAGRRDRPYQYPEPFITWMACIHIFLLMPCRQMEGFTRKLCTDQENLAKRFYIPVHMRSSLL